MLLADFLPRRHFHLAEAAADVCSFNMASGRRLREPGAWRPLPAALGTAAGEGRRITQAILSIPSSLFSLFLRTTVQRACTLGSGKPITCVACRSLDEPCHPSGLIFLGGKFSSYLAMRAQSLSRVCISLTPWTVARPSSSVHGIFQARTLEWVALSSSRESNLCLLHLLH